MMTLFKKPKTDSKKDDAQDIDFLKQSINTVPEEKASKTTGKLPKLTEILGNQPGVKSKLSDINFEAKTVEERDKGNIPEQNKPAAGTQKPDSDAPSTIKPNVQDVRATLAAVIKGRSENEEKVPGQAAPTAGVTTPGAAPGQAPPKPGGVAPSTAKPVGQAAPMAGVKTPGAAPGQAAAKSAPASSIAGKPGVQAPSATGVKPPAMAQNSLKEVQAQLASQKKLIDEQNTIIRNLEATMKKMVSRDVNQLVTKNQELLKQLSQRMNTIEQNQSTEAGEALSDEEKALVKAGKYLENQITKVNEVYDKLDTKISDMRKFMAEVDEKEREFVETEDQLHKIQRRAESVIESELLGKSNEAIRNLEETKTKIVEESEKVFEDTEKKMETFKSDIESLKQKAESSINETGEQLKVTEYEVKKAIDEKIEYDKENMKRVDEVISTMNETVQKILGKEDKNE